MGIDSEAPRSLAHCDILDSFESGGEFVRIIGGFYQRMANEWGCDVQVSARRLLDVHDYYSEDIERTATFGLDRKVPQQGGAGEEILMLDHFKHASFLAFWLRRCVPINETWPLRADSLEWTEDDEPTAEQEHFIRYGNEYCALIAGLQIALNYQLQAQRSKLRGAARQAHVSKAMANFKVPDRFAYEFPALMKHKNMSPHALYMAYCALFEPGLAAVEHDS